MARGGIQRTEAAQLAVLELAQQRRDVRNWLPIATAVLVVVDVFFMLAFGRLLDVTDESRAALLEIDAVIAAALMVLWRIGASRPLAASTVALLVYWGAQLAALATGAMPSKLFVFELIIKLGVTSAFIRAIARPMFAAAQLRARGIDPTTPMAMPRARIESRTWRSGD